jgi:hypothetical protein
MRKWRVMLTVLLCITLLLSMVVHADQTPTPTPTPKSDKATSTPDNKVVEEKKVSGKKVKKPPYVITVNGSIEEDLSEAIWDLGGTYSLNLLGKREEEKIEGEWQFYVVLTYTFAGETKKIDGVEGGLTAGFEMRMEGTAKGKLIDLVAKKKKEDKENKEKGITPTPTPKQTPVHADDPATVKNSQEAPIETYSAEFEAELTGSIRNLGEQSIGGRMTNENGSQWVEAGINLATEGVQREKATIKLKVDGNNNAIVDITAAKRSVGPFVGIFTSEEELQVKRKESYKWPIWGVWTDINPYEPMPNLQKDVETIKEQIKKNETPKKINYPIGRWVFLKAGKKEDPTIYKTIQVSKDDITFETGEIWPYPGSAMFVPTELTVYSKNLQEVIKTSVPYEYEQVIKYSTITDTIDYPDFGRLVRVRSSNLLGVWSSAGELEMPDVSSDKAITPGIWYEFTRGTEEDAEKTQKGFSAAYSFTRLTVKEDRSMTIEKGSAIMMPIAEDEMVTLSGIKTEAISPEGKSEMSKEEKDDETLLVSDFSKEDSTIKLNLQEYTLIPGLSLKGSWSTENPPYGPPDVEGGAFSIKSPSGEIIEPSADGNWIDFDSEKKAFTWTQMLESPEGILVRKGKYRTIGKDLLLLTDIKGSFYAKPGSKFESFKDKEYMYGEKLFQIEQTKKDDKPDSLSIGGVGSFKPMEE